MHEGVELFPLKKELGTMPECDLPYTHLTVNEICYIKTLAGLYTNYTKEATISFIKKHPDLKKYEEKLFSNDFTLKKMTHPHWCTLHLISYGRIHAPCKLIRLLTEEWKEIYYEGSPFINLRFIEKFKETGFKIGYSKNLVTAATLELLTMSLYYRISTEKIINILDAHSKLMETKEYGGHIRIRPIWRILHQMGYEIDSSKLYQNGNSKSNLCISPNMSPEYREALEEYPKQYGLTVSKKTLQTVSSHIRSFLNYMADNYPEIKKLDQITNAHISAFIKQMETKENFFKRNDTAETINNRLEAIANMWKYFIQEGKFNIKTNIVSKYAKLKQHKKYAKYISIKDCKKLTDAINNIDEKEHGLMKSLFIIMLSTGRRVHEVLSLKYECLSSAKGKPMLIFHKLKHDKGPKLIPISKTCEIEVIKAKEFAEKFTKPIYSDLDGIKARRLFPSPYTKGARIVGRHMMKDFFNKLQVENGIVDSDGEPKFIIHDIKRVFVSGMSGKGATPEFISQYLGQRMNSMLPYESNNSGALQVLKLAESKGLLIGNSFEETSKEDIEDNEYKRMIIESLKNADIVNRHKENLIFKIQNPYKTMPLAVGICTDNSNVEICGSLICIACKEYKLESMEEFKLFILKMYKHIYKFKRHSETNAIEEQLEKSIENLCINKEGMSRKELDEMVRGIKRQARKEVNDEQGGQDDRIEEGSGARKTEES